MVTARCHEHSSDRIRWPAAVSVVLFVLVACFVGLPPSLVRAAGGDLLGQFGDTLAGKQEALAGAVFSDGRIVLVGYTTGEDYRTVCLKADGSGVLWSATFDLAGGNDRATAVMITGDGNVVVSGQAWNGSNYDIHTIKYDGNSGAVLWQHTFDAGYNGSDYARALAVDALDNVYVGGVSQGAGGNEDFLLLKYPPSGPTAEGKPLWQRTYDGGVGGNDGVVAMVAGTDFVAVTGYSHNGTDFDYRTIRYTLDGTQVWSKGLDSGNGNDQPKAVTADGSGNVVVTGYVSSGASTDIRTVAYAAADGTVLWSRTYDGGNGDEPRALTVAGGDVYLTGFSYSLSGFNDFYTARLAGANGAVVWETTFDSGGSNGDIALAVTVDGSGDVFVTGYTQKFGGDADIQTIKYAGSTGTQLWQRNFDGAAGKDDEAVVIGTANGTVLVAGWSDQWTAGASDYDFYFLQYDAGLLNAPSNLTATATSNTEVALSWQDNSTNEDGFAIWRDGGNGFVQVATVGADTTSYTDTGLTAHVWYTYKIKATSGTLGDSQFSNEAAVLTTYLSYDTPTWVYVYDSSDSGDDFARSVAVDGSGHPVVTGSTLTAANGSYPSDDYLTIKLDRADASEQWQAAYNDPDDEMDRAVSVAVDGDDAVIVTGNASLFGGSMITNDLFTRKYLATGPADGPPTYGDPYVWDDAYNGPGGGDDRGVAVAAAASAANKVGVTGYGRNASGNDDIYLLLYDADGNRLWTAPPYDGGGHDYPAAIAFDAAGNLYLAGKTHNGTDYDLFLRRYNGANGAADWTVTTDVAGGDDAFVALAVDDNGDILVGATVTNASGNTDMRLAKYAGTTGVLQWSRDYDGPAGSDDATVAIGIDRLRDEILIAGTRLTGSGDHDFHLRRYDDTGNLVWERTLERPSNEDYAVALSVDVSGNACLAGYSVESGNDNVITVCYDADGVIIGSGRYAGSAGGDDRPAAMAVNRYGEAYVAGYTTNSSGNADYLVFRAPATLISAPTDVTATALYTSVHLSWTDNSLDEDAFQIERKSGACTDSGTWNRIVDTAVDATTYDDSGLDIGSTYCYRIRSHNAANVTSAWIEVEASTTVPPAPSDLAGSAASSTAIDLTWTDNTTGEDEFLLERCSGAGCSDFAALAAPAADSTSYTDASVCEGTTYSYRILARKNGVWVSDYSTVAADITTPAKATPGSFAASRVSEGEIALTWTDTTADESGFTIERCEGAGCDFSTVITIDVPANSTSWNDTDSLVPDTTYRYRIRSYKTASCGWQSAFSPVQEATTTLMAPSDLTASATDTTTVDLTWTDNTGFETGFVIERCEGVGCDFSTVTTFSVGADTTAYTDDTVCQGTTYRYRIKATSSSWTTGYSNAVEVSTPAAAAPVLTAVTRQDEETITLAWTDTTSDETGFEIERCVGSGCDFTSAVTTTVAADTTGHTDTGLTPDTTYRYRLRATKSASCAWSGPWAGALEATTTLTAPADLVATAVDTTTVDLSWSDTTDHETGFVVERCTGSGCSDFAVVAAAGAAATGATDDTVCQGGTYSYRVKAVNQGLIDGMNDCWTRRKPLTISGFQADALVSFSVDYDADMQTDFDDLRFFDETAAVELPYWIEEKTDGVSATVWVKTGSNAAITMYYGNPSAVDAGSFSSLFLFGDTFAGTTIDTGKWVEIDPDGAIDQNEGLLLRYVTNNWSRALISSQTFDRQEGRTVFMRVRPEDGPAYDYFMAGWDKNQTSNPSYTQLIHALGWMNTRFYVYEYGSFRGDLGYTPYSSNIWYESKVVLKSSGATYAVRGGSYDTWQIVNDTTSYTTTPLRVGIMQNSHQATIAFVGVTDLAIPDMTVTLGAEEQDVSCFSFTNTWTSAPSNTVVVTPPSPTAPGGLALTPVSESQIDLAWTDNTSDETSFVIERCQGGGCSDFATVATLAADITAYSDMGLRQSTTYTYRVAAKKNSPCPWTISSATGEASTLAPPPPSDLAAVTADTTSIDLAWTDNTGTESGFLVERCTGSACSDFAEIGRTGADATSYTDEAACYGTTYTYQVKAFNEMANDGGGSWSRRAPLTINDFQADFQVRLEVPYDADMQTDFDDLRFYDETAQTEVPYWIESKSDGVSAVVWIRTRTNNDIAMYYGNPQATDASDPSRVFSGFAANIATATLDTDLQNSDGFIIEALVTADSLTNAGPEISFDVTGNGDEKTLIEYDVAAGVFRRLDTDAGGATSNEQTQTFTYPTGVAKTWKIVVTDATYSFSFDGIEQLTATNLPYTHGNVTAGGWDTGDTGTFHWLRIRRYAATEPSVAIGAEEAATTPTPWTSAASNTAEATTDGLPAAPTLTASRASEVAVDLSWNDTAIDESGYRIQRCQGVGCTDFVELTTVAADSTTYSDTGLTPMTTYRYRVQAYKNATCNWEGPYSNASADVTTTIAPPDGLVATVVNTTRIDLSWNDNTASETGFEIERCTGSGCSDFTLLITVAADTTEYSDTTPTHSTTYRYRVRATGSGWTSDYSNPTADSTTPTPVAPDGLVATRASEVAIDLAWNDNTDDETGFEIERCTGSGCSDFTLLATVVADTTTYADSSLAPNTTYRYRVRAYKTATAAWKTAYSATAETTTSVQAPEFFSSGTPNTTQIDLTWIDNTVSETGFELERCMGSGCSDFSLLASLAADSTSYSDTTVCAGQKYRYRIRAVKSGDWNSPYSTPTEDITTPSPSTPTDFVAVSSTEDSVTLSWTDTTSDESGFSIERCIGEGCTDFLVLDSTAADQESYTDIGLNPSTTYCYRIEAVKVADCPWSSEYTTPACDRTMPAMPTDLVATALDSMRIRLDWTDNATDEDSYRIEERVWNGRWVTLDTVAADATSYISHLGIEAEKTYTYRVRAVRGADQSAPSNEASATTPAYQADDTTCR